MRDMAATIVVKLDDRRVFLRRSYSTAVGIDTSTRRGRVGVTRNVSPGGVLFHSRSRFALGEEIDLRIRPPNGRRAERFVRGVVVRSDSDRRDTLFPNLTAVAFPEPLPELGG
jgi:hypothetical protein